MKSLHLPNRIFLAVLSISASSFAKQVPTTEELGEDGVVEREAWSEAQKMNGHDGHECETRWTLWTLWTSLKWCTVLTWPSSDIQRHSASFSNLVVILVSSWPPSSVRMYVQSPHQLSADWPLQWPSTGFLELALSILELHQFYISHSSQLCAVNFPLPWHALSLWCGSVASRSGCYLGRSHLIPKLHRSRAVEHKQPWHSLNCWICFNCFKSVWDVLTSFHYFDMFPTCSNCICQQLDLEYSAVLARWREAWGARGAWGWGAGEGLELHRRQRIVAQLQAFSVQELKQRLEKLEAQSKDQNSNKSNKRNKKTKIR